MSKPSSKKKTDYWEKDFEEKFPELRISFTALGKGNIPERHTLGVPETHARIKTFIHNLLSK